MQGMMWILIISIIGDLLKILVYIWRNKKFTDLGVSKSFANYLDYANNTLWSMVENDIIAIGFAGFFLWLITLIF